MATRQATISIRDRQVSGGALPSNAQMGEPFVNLYDGILKFSGVTGGGFESSSTSTVFEVGSNLYNQKITNRLNINGNFVISGDTGTISTYAGTTGSGLNGKFLSGTTSGLVLANISDIQGTSTIVRQGSNISTGGTVNSPIINVVASPSFNGMTLSGAGQFSTVTSTSLSATTLSGGTILSGGTNLYSIFQPIGQSASIITGTTNQISASTITGTTTLSLPSNVQITGTLNVGSTSGVQWGGGISGTINGFLAMDSNGVFRLGDSGGGGSPRLILGSAASSAVSIKRFGTSAQIRLGDDSGFGSLMASSLSASSMTTGRIPYIGSGGAIIDKSGFEFDATNNLLKTPNIQIGNSGDSGTTTTIYGNLILLGDVISGFTSQLYIEDNLVELNYNPTASTTSTSLGSGWSVQDGSGVQGTAAILDIRGTGTGVANRGWATNLNDIYIRESGTVSSPNGVRVIAEGDFLDGGSY